jgi:hypothetical protein
MDATKRGHRDAAQGVEKNPFDFVSEPRSHDMWIDARARVLGFQAKGRDPNGHAPAVPHICTRSISETEAAKVCNCCSGCATACWAEGFEGTAERLKSTARGLLRKLIGR